MNHKLKFRAWDILSKQFYDEKSLFQRHYTLSLRGKFQNLQNGSGGDENVNISCNNIRRKEHILESRELNIL